MKEFFHALFNTQCCKLPLSCSLIWEGTLFCTQYQCVPCFARNVKLFTQYLCNLNFEYIDIYYSDFALKFHNIFQFTHSMDFFFPIFHLIYQIAINLLLNQQHFLFCAKYQYSMPISYFFNYTYFAQNTYLSPISLFFWLLIIFIFFLTQQYAIFSIEYRFVLYFSLSTMNCFSFVLKLAITPLFTQHHFVPCFGLCVTNCLPYTLSQHYPLSCIQCRLRQIGCTAYK